MPSKFDPRKHHRRSIRLPEYDYEVPVRGFSARCVLCDDCRMAEELSVWGGCEWGYEIEQGGGNCSMGMVGITETIAFH